MTARIKMFPPFFAFHPHLCTPIPAFVLPQKFTKPHNDLDQELLWLKINLTANKQRKQINPMSNYSLLFWANSFFYFSSAPDNTNIYSSAMYDQHSIGCTTEFHPQHCLLARHQQMVRAGMCEKAAADWHASDCEEGVSGNSERNWVMKHRNKARW